MARPPVNRVETILANCRPQPAVPALFVLLLCGLYFFMMAPQIPAAAAWGLTLGLLVSCGLAVAAGFCSLFPMAAWIVLGLLLFGTRIAMLPWHSRAALYIGILVAAVMIAVQLWRVSTGRFVPTVDERAD